MAKTSGAVTGGFAAGDSNYKGKISNVGSLRDIKNPEVYKAVTESISRYHSVLGVRQKNVRLATLSNDVNGVHVTTGGKSDAIYLNEKVYNLTKKQIEARTQSAYKSGWSTKTNKPIGHTVVHELGHATWNSHLSSAKHIEAGKEIRALHKKWRSDKNKSGYGEYSKTNINEFWAETTTKAVHGKPDKYTKALKGIIKRYKL